MGTQSWFRSHGSACEEHILLNKECSFPNFCKICHVKEPQKDFQKKKNPASTLLCKTNNTQNSGKISCERFSAGQIQKWTSSITWRETGTGTEISNNKAFHIFTILRSVSKSSADMATTLYKTIYTYNQSCTTLYPRVEARRWYCRWFQEPAAKGLLDLVLVFLNWGILNSKYNCKEPE